MGGVTGTVVTSGERDSPELTHEILVVWSSPTPGRDPRPSSGLGPGRVGRPLSDSAERGDGRGGNVDGHPEARRHGENLLPTPVKTPTTTPQRLRATVHGVLPPAPFSSAVQTLWSGSHPPRTFSRLRGVSSLKSPVSLTLPPPPTPSLPDPSSNSLPLPPRVSTPVPNHPSPSESRVHHGSPPRTESLGRGRTLRIVTGTGRVGLYGPLPCSGTKEGSGHGLSHGAPVGGRPEVKRFAFPPGSGVRGEWDCGPGPPALPDREGRRGLGPAGRPSAPPSFAGGGGGGGTV